MLSLVRDYLPLLVGITAILAVGSTAAAALVLWLERRQADDSPDAGLDLVADRPHRGRHRRPGWAQRVIRHPQPARRPVCRPRLAPWERDTVEVQTVDPPEGGGRRGR